MIDQFQNICGIWSNWFWNCFCCLTCQLIQHLTVFLSWKVVCLFWNKLCFCDLGTIFNFFWWWWLRWKIFVVVFSLFCWQSLFDTIGPVIGVIKSKVLFFGSRFNIWTYYIWSVVFQSHIFYLTFLPRTVDFWWRRTGNFILIICVSIFFCDVQFFLWLEQQNFFYLWVRRGSWSIFTVTKVLDCSKYEVIAFLRSSMFVRCSVTIHWFTARETWEKCESTADLPWCSAKKIDSNCFNFVLLCSFTKKVVHHFVATKVRSTIHPKGKSAKKKKKSKLITKTEVKNYIKKNKVKNW